jgi:hypothetical protein
MEIMIDSSVINILKVMLLVNILQLIAILVRLSLIKGKKDKPKRCCVCQNRLRYDGCCTHCSDQLSKHVKEVASK